ncbi:MAG: hypothetical protein IJ199_01075 [Prevotella sp.]|nr:hypothetical protein [Prevotella sp.]
MLRQSSWVYLSWGEAYLREVCKLRADYGKGLLKELAAKLSVEFGKGFDESNLRYMRLFYRCFPIRDTLRHELT